MEAQDFTANDGLKTIQSVIERTKRRYEENGLWIMVWGILVCIAGIIQFIMIQQGNGDQSGLVWLFTMVPAGIVMFITKWREGAKRAQTKKSGNKLGFVWMMAGVMAMLTGFLFYDKFGQGFITMMYAPFCVAALAVGLQIKSNLLITMSIVAAVISYAALFIAFRYHPLIASSIGLVLLIIPGVKLFNDYKKRQRV